MHLIRSLLGKILFGHLLVGGLFVLLVAGALIHFRGLEIQLAEQERVATFYDALRDARRQEKNYLLYHRRTDLNEAIDKANVTLHAFREISPSFSAGLVDARGMEEVTRYRDLLAEMGNPARRNRVPQDIQEELYTVGGNLLQMGARLDAHAREKTAAAVKRHQRDLTQAILGAIVLALVAGFLATRSVVRPLREVEASLEKIAKGEAGRIEGGERDSEVESLTDSINQTLQEIETRQRHLARSSRLVALGTMLSGVAHELNNPLSNISSSCQILMEELDDMPPDECQRLLAQIDDQVLRAQRIVSVLLDFARDRKFRRGPEPVHRLVEEALVLVRHQLPPEARVELDIPEALAMDVDRQRFQQVLVNLVKNAAEAIERGGRIRLRAWRDAPEEGQGTALEIEDDGMGIPADQIPRIFDPFFTTKAVGKGTGLGLFVAHEIVEQHGGRIRVDSAPGQGARFRIHIPDLAEND